MEDLTAYTEDDLTNRLSQTPARNTFTGVRRNEQTLLYKDAGVGHYSGNNLAHLFDGFVSSGDSRGYNLLWALANQIDDKESIRAEGDDLLGIVMFVSGGGSRIIALWEIDSGTEYNDSMSFSFGTIYYYEVEWDKTVGTYGTIYLYVYSDPGRITLINLLAIALHSSLKAYRYFYPSMSNDDGFPAAITGWGQNYNLQEVTGNPWYYYAQQ